MTSADLIAAMKPIAAALIGVLRAQGPRLQMEYLRSTAEDLSVAGLLERALETTRDAR